MLRRSNLPSLRAFLAATMALSPALAARAEQGSAARWLTPQTVAAVTLRPADAARLPAAQMYPIEVADAAAKDFLGTPLDSIERVTVVVEPPMGATPQYALVVSSSQKLSFDRLRAELTDHTMRGELLDRPLLESQQDPLPSLCLLDEYTLGVGPKLFLKRLVRGVDGSQTALAEAMRQGDGDQDHFHAAVMFEPLRPLLDLGLMGAKQEAPPEAHPYLDGLLLLNRAVAGVDLSGTHDSSLVVYADDREAADRIESLVRDGMSLLQAKMREDQEYAKLRNHPEAVVRAWGAYVERMMTQQTDAVGQLREGDDAFVLARMNAADPNSQYGAVMVGGVLVALLLPAVQAAREAARRNQSVNNVRQILLALHNYYDTHNSFPAQAICDDQGNPLLSWRVAILPFVEQQELYSRFHLDEAWDSPHNRALVAEMPELFLDSSSALTVSAGKTSYLGVAGPQAAFSGGPHGRKFADIRDGTSRSMMIVQVDDAHAVEWTKPADYDVVAYAANPAGGIGALHPGVFLAGYADGHTGAVPLETDAGTLTKLMTINGNEPVELP